MNPAVMMAAPCYAAYQVEAGLGIDPDLRKQLIDAREALLVQIDEVECRAKAPFREAPDYRDVHAALRKELREIEDILGQDEQDRA